VQAQIFAKVQTGERQFTESLTLLNGEVLSSLLHITYITHRSQQVSAIMSIALEAAAKIEQIRAKRIVAPS
jgi:hypothetical protein